MLPTVATALPGGKKTNTPLQALTTLNDPTFIETARAIGAEMTITGDTRKGIEEAFIKLTGRTPSAKELDLLQDLQRHAVLREFFENRLFAFGAAPAPQKVGQAAKFGLQGLPDVFLEKDAVVLGDQLSVRVQVLRTLDGYAHIHIVDDELGAAFTTATGVTARAVWPVR